MLYFNLFVSAMLCQDLSNAGLGKGMAKGSGTRSGLLWEVERLLDELFDKGGQNALPKVLLMENVPAVIGAKNIQHFAKWQEKLESFGYKNKWELLNAKDYGIPQNRERCFMVSILGDYFYDFPKKIPLKLRLKDMLEKEVDEKYYLSSSAIERISKWNAYQDPLKDIEKEKIVSPCLTARGAGEEHSGMVLISEPNLKRELCDELIANGMVEEGDVIRHSYTNDRLNNGVKNMGRTESKDKLCPTLDTRCDCLGVTVKDEPKVAEPITLKKYGSYYTWKDKQGNINTQCNRAVDVNGCALTLSAEKTDYAKVIEPIAYDEQNQYLRQDGCVGTLTTDGSSPKHNNRILETNYRIRKLTPKECWRLMGFSDTDIDNAIAVGTSNAQLYKQAGNSIVVNVLMAIFKQIL